MIESNVEFHNITELQNDSYMQGVVLQRFPEAVRSSLGGKAQFRGRMISQVATGAEIRFVTEGSMVGLTITMLDQDGYIHVYQGEYKHSVHYLNKGMTSTLHLDASPGFELIEAGKLNTGRFSPKVWRVMFGRNKVLFNGIDAYGYSLRPPKPDEVPSVKWLAYGSSITMGVGSHMQPLNYIQSAAARLGVDVYNNGLSGACLCEHAMGHFLAERDDWDIATLELGVNMRALYTPAEFEQLAGKLIETIVTKNPNKKVAVVTIFPNWQTWPVDHEKGDTDRAYNRILHNICDRMNAPNLYVIEGHEILKKPYWLSNDLVHPSDHGHIAMGEQIAAKLAKILNLKHSFT